MVKAIVTTKTGYVKTCYAVDFLALDEMIDWENVVKVEAKPIQIQDMRQGKEKTHESV